VAQNIPLTPEILVPRLGDHLVEKQYISRSDLERALQKQRELRDQGQQPQLLGSLLVEMGVIDRVTLEEAVTEQILQLRSALQESNRELERRVEQRTQELQAALQKLSELSQLKANFIANISHELRTPMTHIKGYLDLLVSGDLGEINEDQQRSLQIMQRSSERLENLIEDLILFSLMERDQVTLHLQLCNLKELCQNVLHKSQPKAAQKQIDLKLEYTLGPTLVEADQEKIFWVMLQLLDNAIKFTAANGKVKLRVEAQGEFARVSIIDNGIGIPADQMETIFEPFHQVDGSSTRRYSGTGLGLALVRKIVEGHGSIMQVSSMANRGSRFTFYLKLSHTV